jgi:hypothetical protein
VLWLLSVFPHAVKPKVKVTAAKIAMADFAIVLLINLFIFTS